MELNQFWVPLLIAGINFLRHTHFRNVIHYCGSHPGFRGKKVPPNGRVSLWT